jgi:hypothetical protein
MNSGSGMKQGTQSDPFPNLPVDSVHRCCPGCARVDAKAGAVWGCQTCAGRYAAGYRWWDLPREKKAQE